MPASRSWFVNEVRGFARSPQEQHPTWLLQGRIRRLILWETTAKLAQAKQLSFAKIKHLSE